MSHAPIDRRRFVLASAAATATLCCGARLPIDWGGLFARSAPSLTVRLASLLPPGGGVRWLGLAFLETMPGERDAVVLAGRIAATLGVGSESLLSDGDDALRALLDARVRQDFAEHRTVELGGWWLSVTEARLCALNVVAGTAG